MCRYGIINCLIFDEGCKHRETHLINTEYSIVLYGVLGKATLENSMQVSFYLHEQLWL
jgi:hypothetical protein